MRNVSAIERFFGRTGVELRVSAVFRFRSKYMYIYIYTKSSSIVLPTNACDLRCSRMGQAGTRMLLIGAHEKIKIDADCAERRHLFVFDRLLRRFGSVLARFELSTRTYSYRAVRCGVVLCVFQLMYIDCY